MIAKGVKGKEYILTDIMATSLSRSQFEKLQAINEELLGDYHYIPQNETDFSWWDRINRKLTVTRIKTAYFECDYYGNVREL